MRDLFPCDLGDGIEVVHEVEEDVEIELDCDLDEDGYSLPYERIEIQFDAAAIIPAFEPNRLAALHVTVDRSPVWDTLPFSPLESLAETVPYPRQWR